MASATENYAQNEVCREMGPRHEILLSSTVEDLSQLTEFTYTIAY